MKEMCMLGKKGFRCFGIFLWIVSILFGLVGVLIVSITRKAPLDT